LTLQTLVIRYAFFAIMATLANLAIQRAVLWFGDSSTLFALAVGTGTATGLLIKYILDKLWIFEDISAGLKVSVKKFLLYTAMGIVTTAIFWGVETAFWLFWQTDMMRELGAVIGLSIGYLIKYRLDRRYVFTDARLVQLT
jgi:putative flippase GtrA